MNDYVNRSLELAITISPERVAGEFHGLIWLNATPFQRIPPPCMKCHDGNAENKAIAHFEACAAKDLAGRFGSHDGGEVILFGEARDRLRGARGVLIHQQNDPPVERLRAEALGDHHNRPVAKRVAK